MIRSHAGLPRIFPILGLKSGLFSKLTHFHLDNTHTIYTVTGVFMALIFSTTVIPSVLHGSAAPCVDATLPRLNHRSRPQPFPAVPPTSLSCGDRPHANLSASAPLRDTFCSPSTLTIPSAFAEASRNAWPVWSRLCLPTTPRLRARPSSYSPNSSTLSATCIKTRHIAKKIRTHLLHKLPKSPPTCQTVSNPDTFPKKSFCFYCLN